MGPKQNQKAVAARERQDKLEAERSQKKAAADERKEAEEWKRGSNLKAERRYVPHHSSLGIWWFNVMYYAVRKMKKLKLQIKPEKTLKSSDN